MFCCAAGAFVPTLFMLSDKPCKALTELLQPFIVVYDVACRLQRLADLLTWFCQNVCATQVCLTLLQHSL
jgi:hypothetical protein